MLDAPDADPTCSTGTHEVEADDAGPLDIPMPTATAMSGMTKARYSQSASASPMTANPAVVMANPRPTTCRAPSRAANLGTRGATTTRPTVAGSVASPACRGVNPSELGSWNHRLSTYISALIVPAPMRIATVDPTSTRLRSSARSSSGTATRFSTMTKAMAASTATTRQPMVAAEAQPQALPLLRARMSGPRVSAMSALPV